MRAYFFLILCLVPLIGCQRAPVKRTYHEIVQSAPQQPPPAMMPMSGELDMSSIPMDDIHASLREGQGVSTAMPMTGAMDQETQKMLEASVVRPPLSWTTPQGWQEIPGSGMRLVSFASADKDNPVECTIVSLGGQAGGLESNAARWMQQVNIAVPAQAQLEQFLSAQKKIQTKDGFTAAIIDLTQLQPKEDLQSPSLMATIIALPDTTVFIKMTGGRGAILKNKDKFETLCQSLKLN